MALNVDGFSMTNIRGEALPPAWFLCLSLTENNFLPTTYIVAFLGGRHWNTDMKIGRNMKPSAPEHACNECRIRKVRCDRKSPLCSSCLKSGLVCQYTKGKRIDHTKKLSVSS